MTKRISEDDDSNDPDNSQVVDENAVPGTLINEDNQYDIAMERNRLRWEYQEMYEKAAIEMYINEDAAMKQRKFICQAVNMSEIVLNVQEALHAGVEHDLLKATENLKKLLREPFTTMSLLYAPSIVKTVYLCCRYEKSQEVRALAKLCYNRFEPCFGVPEGETFETTFQAEVREFWKQQKAVVYDSSKYSWAHFTMCDDDDDTSVEDKNSIKEDNAERMEIELKPIKSEMKVKIENIKIKCESDDKNAIKKEIKSELLDDKSRIKKEISLKTECADDKNLIKKEITKMKVECKTDINDEPFDYKPTIKEEIMDMDTDDIEITYSSIDKKVISSLPKLSVKLEPIDLEKLNAEYNSDEDCYILN